MLLSVYNLHTPRRRCYICVCMCAYVYTPVDVVICVYVCMCVCLHPASTLSYVCMYVCLFTHRVDVEEFEFLDAAVAVAWCDGDVEDAF